MRRIFAVVIVVAALAVFVAEAATASSSGDNEPILAGADNNEGHATYLTNTTTGATGPAGAALHLTNSSGAWTLTVTNASGRSGENAGAVMAMGTNSVVGLAHGSMGLAVGGDTSLSGRLRLSYSGKVTIPAGATSASVKPPVIEGQPPAIGENTLAFATIQQHRKTSVRAVVLDPKAQTLTIYLTRPVNEDTTLGWMLVD